MGLHEQDAFNWLLGGPLGRLLGRHVSVIPQRQDGMNLNTFPRNLYDAQYKDPESAEWVVGDFTAHCSGLHEQLREWCIEDSCAVAETLLAGQRITSERTKSTTLDSVLGGRNTSDARSNHSNITAATVVCGNSRACRHGNGSLNYT